MKRRLFGLLVCLAMVYGCTLLDARAECMHVAWCDDPTTCFECGATEIVAEYVEHDGDWMMAYDAYYHWEACATCGDRVEVLYGHTGYCNDSTSCMYCGATGIVSQETEHPWDVEEAQYDDLYCWTYCTACETTYDKTNHSAGCYKPNQCIYCYNVGVTITDFYNHDERYLDAKYQHISDTQCQWSCEDCGMGLEDPVQHVAYCWSKETCYHCGYTACVDAIVDEHDDKGDYIVISDTLHQLVCGACGEPIEEPSEHWAFCSGEQSSWCYICSYEPVVNPNVAHEMMDDEMGYDTTRHWYKCSACGEPMECDDAGTIYVPHVANCDMPNACLDCGATGITAETVQHAGSWEWTYNDTKHFYECSACGETKADKYYQEQHFSTCDAPTYCWNCDYVGANCMVLHAYVNFDDGSINFEGALLSDANGHWRVCPDCGDKTPEKHTFDSKNICTECGYEKKTVTRLPGDADNSKGVTLTDAIAILEYASGSGTSINTANADVNADGNVDAYDALLILQYIAGWNVTLK